MADFCRKHYLELFAREGENGDKAELSIQSLELEEGQVMWVLCESCGFIAVGRGTGDVECVWRPDSTTASLMVSSGGKKGDDADKRADSQGTKVGT